MSGPLPPAAGTLDELVAEVRPAWAIVRRSLPEIVLGVAVLLTVLGGLALVGAAMDDATIARNRAVATAEVLDGSSWSRTLVRFTAASGQTVVPPNGVSYPRGLVAGQAVAVEYDVTDPELVRVAGRSWVDGIAPMAGGLAVVWLVLGGTAHLIRRARSS
ncbi:DUF3592 domain-containing protein [Pseudonocardia sp.]|uniref:DUF3592 domain-containing protein n=1 Tax=Pseudonocardia sp. TaxID=60912 RepID=UPI003D0BE3D9